MCMPHSFTHTCPPSCIRYSWCTHTHTPQIATAAQLEPATRSLAAECLVTLCEARDKAPGMMRRLPNFVGSLFEMLMGFLLDVEDDSDWHKVNAWLCMCEHLVVHVWTDKRMHVCKGGGNGLHHQWPHTPPTHTHTHTMPHVSLC